METGKIRVTVDEADIKTILDFLNGRCDDRTESGCVGIILFGEIDENFENDCEDEFEDAYEDGFNEGYDAGYADGYMKAKKEAFHNGKNA